MQISNKFRKTIARYFYDKTFFIYDVADNVDEYGFAKTTTTFTKSAEFKGNIRFDNLDDEQQIFGKSRVVKAVITTDTNVLNGNIVGYNSTYLQVISSIAYDSHYKLVLSNYDN